MMYRNCQLTCDDNGHRSRHRNCLALLLLASLVSGCAVEPWVKPYEREKLADPIMSFDRNPVATSFMNHVRDAREAARGADGGSGGGCGCN